VRGVKEAWEEKRKSKAMPVNSGRAYSGRVAGGGTLSRYQRFCGRPLLPFRGKGVKWTNCGSAYAWAVKRRLWRASGSGGVRRSWKNSD